MHMYIQCSSLVYYLETRAPAQQSPVARRISPLVEGGEERRVRVCCTADQGMTWAMRPEHRNGPRRVGAQGRIPVSAHGKLDAPLALASTQELSCASSTYSGFQHGTGMVRVLGLLCFGSNVDPQQWK